MMVYANRAYAPGVPPFLNIPTSANGYKRTFGSGQSVSALPPCSDIRLLGDRECIIDLDTKVSDSALDL